MITPNTIIKPMKIRRNQNLIKCSYWPSQHCLQVILGEEEEEEIYLVIDQGDQEAVL